MAKEATNYGTIIDKRRRLPFVLVERVILRTPSLSNNAKLLYLFLADYAGAKESCFPGQLRLARDLALRSVDTVQRALNELRAIGLIDWKRRGLNRPNCYYLLPLENNPTLVARTALKGIEADTAPMRHPDTALVRHLETASVRSKQDSEKRDTGQQHPHPPSAASPADLASTASADVVVLLHTHGISKRAAQALAGTYPPERIRQKVHVLEYLQSIKSRLVAQSPAGWLRRAIEEDYEPPKGFASAQLARGQRTELAQNSRRQRARKLAEQATELRRPAHERAQAWLAFYERTRILIHRRPLTAVERTRKLKELVAQARRESHTFFRENPHLEDEAKTRQQRRPGSSPLAPEDDLRAAEPAAPLHISVSRRNAA